MTRTFRVAIYGVLTEGAQVLMTRSSTRRGPIMNFPGGAIDWGEAPADALAREFREETGIMVEVGRLLYCTRGFHFNPDYPDQQSYHTYYEVRQLSGELNLAGNSDDVLESRWVPIESLPIEGMVASDLEFAEFLRKSL